MSYFASFINTIITNNSTSSPNTNHHHTKMSFHASAQDIRVDEGHILRARLNNGGGDFVDAELDLNNVIGNNDGKFHPSCRNRRNP